VYSGHNLHNLSFIAFGIGDFQEFEKFRSMTYYGNEKARLKSQGSVDKDFSNSKIKNEWRHLRKSEEAFRPTGVNKNQINRPVRR